MKRAALSLVFIVGCRFDLPKADIDAQGEPVDAQGEPVDAQGDEGSDAPPIDAPVPGCPADFAPLPGGPAGHVYRKALQDGTWSAQFDFCRGTSARAYLAVPNDATELTNLFMLASSEFFWVGIDDRVTEGMYVEAETGAPATFLPWHNGEPDNAPGGGDCIMSRGTAIEDYACGVNRAAVCECNP